MRHIVLGFAFLTTFLLFSQNQTLKKEHYNLEKELAIQGYDPVSYFSNGKALKGDKKFAHNHQGVIYLFINEENKTAFQKEPIKYEPQYGGWCAYAMGESGKKIEVDPKTFKILDGKLYLFYNAYFTNTLKSWNQDEKNLKINADKNWQKIIQK
ncbi:MAG: YHS domain-containing (seleno)protein [Cytophagales bacterium]